MAKENNFDANKDYYNIFNVSEDVTKDELCNIMDTNGSNFTDEQHEAYAVLIDSKQRKQYDKARAKQSKNNNGHFGLVNFQNSEQQATNNGNGRTNGGNGHSNGGNGHSNGGNGHSNGGNGHSNGGNGRRQRVVNTQNGVQSANKGRNILKNVAIAAIVLAILATSVSGAMLADKYNLFTGGKGKGKNVFDDQIVGDQYEEAIGGDTELDSELNTELTPEEENGLVNGVVKNFGDATNQQDLGARVDDIQEQLLSLKVSNIQTGQPYSDKEIEDIIKYINGAYLPEKEADAYTMVDTFLNFVCAEISSMKNLNMVQYQANSDVVTKDIVENDIATCDSFDYSLLLMGDSYCYPVVERFQKYLDELLSTTDRDEYKRIHNQAYQDLANFIFGDGLVIGETRYNIKQLEGLQNQNDAAVFWMQIMKLEIFSVEGIKEEFTVSYSQAGDVIVPIEKIKEQFNVLCMADELQITDDGFVGVPVESNFATNIEVLMINSALGNDYLNNTDMYDNNYQYTKKNN